MTTASEKKITIIIPVFNEAGAIGGTLAGLESSGWTQRAEVIVVDDGSTDETASIVSSHPVRLIQHGFNRGYGAALKTGIRASYTERVIIMDSDGQHTADMLDAIASGLDHHRMVIGDRAAGSHQVRSRTLGKWIIRRVGEHLVEQRLPDFNSGLRGFDRQTIRGLLHLMPNGFSFSTTSTLAFLKLGYSIGSAPIYAKPRVGRKSSVRAGRDGMKTLLLLLRVIMLFNPLKIFLPAAIVVGIWGVALAVLDIYEASRVSNGAVTIMVFSMMLFFFGLLADQVSMLNLRERDSNG